MASEVLAHDLLARTIISPSVQPEASEVEEITPSTAPGQVAWKRSILSARDSLGACVHRAGLQQENFTILSNDCWGQALYEGYGLAHQTPMVSSGMHADCYLRFLEDYEGYLQSPLRFVSNSRHASVRRLRSTHTVWPVGLLGDDVEVHFYHLRTEQESRRVWEDGCRKMDLSRIAVKFSPDKYGATQEHVERFAALPFERKLLISPRQYAALPFAIQIKVSDYLINGAMMFRRSLKYFDCTHWLNTGEVLRETPRVKLSRVLYSRGA